MNLESLILNYLPKNYAIVYPDLKVSILNHKKFSNLLGNTDNLLDCADRLLPFPKSKNDTFIQGIEQYFENFMPAEVTLGMMPDHLNVSGRIVQLNYLPVINERDEAEFLIIELWDGTHEFTQKRLMELQNHKNETLVKILKEKDGFLDFLKDVGTSLEDLQHISDEKLGKRILHTLKGNSSAFGLAVIADKIHEIEDQVDELIDLEGATVLFANIAFEISELFDDFLMDNFEVLGINRQSNELSTFKISEREIWELQRHLKKINNQNVRDKIEESLISLKTKPAQIFVSTFSDTVTRLAENLDKEIQFQVEGGDVKVFPKTIGFVLREVIHIIRNSCDHGIEFPYEREDAGKPACGQIILHIQEHEQRKEIEILIKDDGRGINIEKLVSSAIKKGIISKEKAIIMTDDEKLDLLFHDGVSTAESISQVSGRGVGMAALKQQVEQFNGRIAITTQPGEGSSFQLFLPSTVNQQSMKDEMNVIRWSPSLSLGVEEMDLQHKKLIEYLASLQSFENLWMQGKKINDQKLKAVLDEIVQYTVFHFQAEEKLMEENHFPDFSSHKLLHEKLIEKVTEVLEVFAQEGIEALPRITSFLSNWLKGHILGTDRKYAQHIKSRNLGWNNDLCIGISDMDDQHRVLIDYIQEFQGLASKASEGALDDLKPIKELLTRLTDYTLMHFKEEEELMKSHAYPKYDEHLKLHKRLVKQVINFHEKFKEDPIKVIPELSSFLSRWLIQHIKGADMEYAQHIQSHSGQKSA